MDRGQVDSQEVFRFKNSDVHEPKAGDQFLTKPRSQRETSKKKCCLWLEFSAYRQTYKQRVAHPELGNIPLPLNVYRLH